MLSNPDGRRGDPPRETPERTRLRELRGEEARRRLVALALWASISTWGATTIAEVLKSLPMAALVWALMNALAWVLLFPEQRPIEVVREAMATSRFKRSRHSER